MFGDDGLTLGQLL